MLCVLVMAHSPNREAGVETDGSERAAVEAVLIWAAGSRAGFGQPLSKSIKALD